MYEVILKLYIMIIIQFISILYTGHIRMLSVGGGSP